jgi:putative tricarboxylic transport membrane protein
MFVTYYSHVYLKLGILISPGAGFLPFLCGIALIALGAVWRFQLMLSRRPEKDTAAATEAKPAGSRLKLFLAFLTTVVYAFLFERVGFLLATVVFMLGWQRVVERERWVKALIVTVLSAAALFLLFRTLLHVELPHNPFLS